MEFTKIHGNGNDFVVIDNRTEVLSPGELAELARKLCRRKFSIGADGLLAVGVGDAEADFSMRIFNADGSEGEMCGNGARALARYAFETGLAKASMHFRTIPGIVKAYVEPPYAELDLGFVDLSKGIFGRSMRSYDIEFPFVFLTVGVPHCVLFTEDCDALDDSLKREIGREVSHDFNHFPQGTNVSFAQILSRDEVKAVTYERGVEDLTESCGTGSVAVALAAAIVRDSASRIRVLNPGGVNEVRLIFGEGNTSCRAYHKGKTAMVARGTLLDEAQA